MKQSNGHKNPINYGEATVKKVKQPHGGTLTIPEKGDRFNPDGKPRKLTSKIIADLKEAGVEAVTPGHVSDAISVLLNLTLDDLKRYADDKNAPILIRRTARRLAVASDREWDKVISDNLDRAHGKPKQTNEHIGNADNPIKLNLSTLTVEELRTMARLRKKATGGINE